MGVWVSSDISQHLQHRYHQLKCLCYRVRFIFSPGVQVQEFWLMCVYVHVSACVYSE